MNTSQKTSFEHTYNTDLLRWRIHDTKDPLIRYLRDRRLERAIALLRQELGKHLTNCSILILCGGVGGEATYFCNLGFTQVTNSDFARNALDICSQRDPRIKTLQLNAESIDLPDESYDIIVVQDGLHHLPRPVAGLNEMIRVARRAVVVLEPHEGLIARLLGKQWERHHESVNYVFRWNRWLFRSVIYSQLLETEKHIYGLRIWDHNSVVRRVVGFFGNGRLSLAGAKFIYMLLAPLNFLGNNFIGVLIKKPSRRVQTGE